MAETHQAAAVAAVPLQQALVVPNTTAAMDAAPGMMPTAEDEESEEHAGSDSELPEFQLPRRQLFGSTMATTPASPPSITPSLAALPVSNSHTEGMDSAASALSSRVTVARPTAVAPPAASPPYRQPPPASPPAAAAADFLFCTDEEVFATSSSVLTRRSSVRSHTLALSLSLISGEMTAKVLVRSLVVDFSAK